MRRRHSAPRLLSKLQRRPLRLRFRLRRLTHPSLCARLRPRACVRYGRLPQLRTVLQQQMPTQKTKHYAALFALRARALSADLERMRGLAEDFSYRTLSAAERPARRSFGKHIDRMLDLKLRLAPRTSRKKLRPLAVN